MTKFKVTKEEKIQALEDMLFNSFHGVFPTRAQVVDAATTFAAPMNEIFNFDIDDDDISKIVNRLERRMDFSLKVTV